MFISAVHHQQCFAGSTLFFKSFFIYCYISFLPAEAVAIYVFICFWLVFAMEINNSIPITRSNNFNYTKNILRTCEAEILKIFLKIQVVQPNLKHK